MTSAINNVVNLDKGRGERISPCPGCMKRTLCPVFVTDAAGHNHWDDRIVQKTTRAGQTIFNAGEAFDGIYMVRSGFFKSVYIDANGDIQVTGFYFPGDLFGIEGIETGYYNDTVMALDTGSICRIPFSLFAQQKTAVPEMGTGGDRMLTLVRIMSRAIARDRNMIFALGKMCSKRRFASFLLDVSERMVASGYSGREFRLCMSRTDMSNYLCLAVETISRLFSQFQEFGVIEVDRRNLKILDMQGLRALAGDDGERARMAG